MSVLVTGAAGFIGAHIALKLLERGEDVIGVDDLNSYYDPALKQARLALLERHKGFGFQRGDIAEPGLLEAAAKGRTVTRVMHLAAQAGVRYSLENPRAYIRANLAGHLEVLEFCRARPSLVHLVYASSSSVYGGNEKAPFAESDRVDHPVSLYAATKKADELMSHTYAHLYGVPATGLRFFTVYGPWGRPDMAYWLFTKAMLEKRPIRIFNNGDMWRDFTYIDDIAEGALAVLDRPPSDTSPPHAIYNIGNNRPEHLGAFVDLLEELLGVEAIRQYEPMQAGDVVRTCADISRLKERTGFAPRITLREGLTRFIDWYRDFYQV